METSKEVRKNEEPSVEVFIRPLEVTVPAELIYSNQAKEEQNITNEEPQKTYWSTMTSRIETETSVKRWSIPPVTTVEGKPPGPEDHPSTKEGKEQEGRVIGITPNYKIGEGQPKQELNLGKSGYAPRESGDYKISTLQETYKQTFIDPKVISNANMPHLSTRIPDARPKLAGDFPSEHSKRSQIKLEPLEQRRFRSTESRPISTSNYLTESVERHRKSEASCVRDYLKAKETDANQPWNKPGWPGPKKGSDETVRELETLKQRVETLRKTTSRSMNDLRVPTPSQFDQLNPKPDQSPISPGESGWLIRMRKDRYLNEASRLKPDGPRRFRSVDHLNKEDGDEEKPDGSDPLHWQLRKEFHLTKYTERRASYHVESTSYSQGPPAAPPQNQRHQTPASPPLPPPPPPRPPPQTQSKPTSSQRSQPLYPPGSTEDIASEHRPAVRPVEKVVYENKPVAPAALNVQIRRPKTEDQDYPERLMSPPPTHQPRSILKGYSYSQSTTEMLNPTQIHPRPSDRRTPTHFEDLSEEDKTRIMYENLQRHRNMRSGPSGPRPTPASFNGPFFKLEQVSPQRSHSVDPERQANLQQMKEISASEMELQEHNFKESSVVVWPPVNEKERKRPNSVMSRNVNDPERIEEYQRQKRLEEEAIRRNEEKQLISMTKQFRAMEIQHQRMYEQSHGVTSPVPIMEPMHQQHVPVPPPPPPPPQTPPQPYYQSHQYPQKPRDPEEPPHNMQVYETRPISALSDQFSPQNVPTSWKRTYIVEKPKDVAKNEILTSDELLEKEQYEVDLLKRRETFVEKPEEPVRIHRTGRRWQPPPEKPYVWPTSTLRRAQSVEPGFAHYDDGEEYKWAPVVTDPGYKKEEKNFTPLSSPPASPRRGHGTGPLDEPAKRQAKYVIQPSPDGSHRPKAAFKKERHTPSGGFLPHAPNAIKVVKKRAQSVQGLLSPTDNNVEVIHHRNYHRLDYENGQRLRRTSHGGSEQDLRMVQALPDWEKIYELPPHSSQIVQKDMPRHVDVQRRLSKFEGSIQNLNLRGGSQQQLDTSTLHLPIPDYDIQNRQLQMQQPSRRRNESGSYAGGATRPNQASRRNSVSSTRLESPLSHQHHHSRPSRSDSRGPSATRQHSVSRAASSIPLSPQPRPTTPGASRARNYIARATAPSPTPYSYDRARPYVPAALPPGYRDANKPPANAELDELSKRAEELRKRDGRSKYKLIESDIYKTDPEPVPAHLKDQVRDLLESRNSVETSTTMRDQDKSGYVTDVSTATWNFSTLDYSPRSVVSMNGARDDILKTVPPLRTKTPPPPQPPPPPPRKLYETYETRDRYTSAPNLHSAVIRIQDDKPRSIMKRRELESREQLLYPTVDTQVVKSYVRSKPTVTETVQRFEETRRTEEVERRVQRREKKERRSRHHSSSRHQQSGWEGQTGGYHEFRHASLPRRTVVREADRAMTEAEMDRVVREAYAAADEAKRDSRHRSSSLSRGGYYPGSQETYYRHETTRRQQHNDDNFNRGIAHARYGSLSDSLRRGELKYIPNGEVRESFYGGSAAGGGGSRSMHKSYSTRDVLNGGVDDRRSVASFRRGSQQQISPFVEFPPTLPRRGHADDAHFRPVSKSRSYADWDDAGRAGFGREVRRYDDDMSRLEAEFRDSLLMPMPGGNMNERDHRTEQLPGGYETFNKDRHANSGRRMGRDGKPVDFNESSQEYNYKREQTFDDRRRR